jgi:hypothetical protein
MKPDAGVGIELGKKKHRFIKDDVTGIKDDVTGNIDTTTRRIKALKTFVHVTITQEHTLFIPKLKFVGVETTKVGPIGTTKNPKTTIVGLFMKQNLKRGRKIKNFGGSHIN